MCLQTSSAFLVRNLSVWEIYLCWLISKNSLQSLMPLVLEPTFLLKDVMFVLTIIKITFSMDGLLIWLEGPSRRSRLADRQIDLFGGIEFIALDQGFPNLLFAMHPFSIPRVEHVSLQHKHVPLQPFDRWTWAPKISYDKIFYYHHSWI